VSAGSPDRLFDLLPAIHRVSDAARGDVLRALLGVIQEEFERLEADIERLYDNWFIETCDEWVVAYIGDLLGISGLRPDEHEVASSQDRIFSQRGFVANTLAYRRAKGTAAVLEQLARDVTGWPARAVEYFEVLATTRSMNHARRSDVVTFEVRDANRAELVGSPLEQAAHTAEVRHIDNGRGRYNIPNVGLHLWRLQPYYLVRATARPVGRTSGPTGWFTFDPLGQTTPLFNLPRAETALTQLAAEANVPGPMRRRPLHDELEARRQAVADGERPEELFFDSPPVVRVWIERDARGTRSMELVKPEELLICDLSDRPAPATGWRHPPRTRTYRRRDGTSAEQEIKAAIDPVLGRLALPIGEPSANVEVTYAYGFSGDLGGGPYSRQASVAQVLGDRAVQWQLGVTRYPPVGAANLTTTLRDAVDRWNRLGPGVTGVIAVMDNLTYVEDLDIEIKPKSRLLIVAADWPLDLKRDSLEPDRRSPGRLTATGRRPLLRGRVRVCGTAPPGQEPGALAIDGLLVERNLTVLPGNLGELRISHCTVAPRRGRIRVLARAAAGRQNNQLAMKVVRSITGPLLADGRIASLSVDGCIVDGHDGHAVDSPDTEITASTILGRTAVRTLDASNSIFTDLVETERRQTGCVRYSFLPLASTVPRRFLCQPRDENAARQVAPAFTSTTYGHPGYGQLASSCAPEIAEGADDESELGAFHFLQQPKRVASLTTRLDEYLRFGLEAGIFFVT
jgi:hypothetical protein